MTSIRKLLSALCWAICFSSVSNAQQIDTTGNLINNNNWSGATYGVDPGGCCASISGSGPLYDTSTDTIMFSYGQSTISQTIGLNQALGGTGIQVHGYNYSWEFRYMSNNGNNNDTLTFNVALRNSSGSILESQSYNYDNLFSNPFFQYDTWVTASDTVTYQNPYTDPQSISLSITGRDGGFWGGYYGPEVRNVSLSVNYSFDPCASDPLYSSSCPGYWDAWFAQLCLFWCPTSSEPEVEVASVDYTLAPTTTTTSMSMPEETTTGEVKVDAGGVEISTTGELTVPDGVPEEAREKKPVDMNLIMSIVREATDDSKALEVVNQSIQDSMAEDANPDFTGSPVSATGDIVEDQILQITSIRSNSNLPSSGEEQTSAEETSVTSSQQNPVQETQQQQVTVEQSQEQTEEVTVKQNVEPNEAAGGVDIASIAVSPTGFNDYLTKSLNDARFYEEKEIYAGQTVVDNRRAQRLLNGASDRLHREMVDQQYRRQ